MIWCEPSYIKEFRCIADKCTDTCCAGWEIVLDETAVERYEKAGGSFGERLRKEIKRDGDEAFFSLTRQKRCPFLDAHNLCEIYRELGEDALCDICTEHPRFYNWIGDYTEKGLGLCCEEAERLLFADKEPICFEVHCDCDEDELSEDLAVLLQIRGEAIAILQDRQLSFTERMCEFLNYMQQVQLVLDTQEDEDVYDTEESAAVCQGKQSTESENEANAIGKNPKVQEILSPENANALFSFFASLDYLDARFIAVLHEAKNNLDEILAQGLSKLEADADRTYEWEHIAVYFLYRYFTEAVYDGDVLIRARLVTVCLKMLALMAGQIAVSVGYTETKRDELLRMFSRELEYCPENMDAIYEAIRVAKIS